MSVFKKHYTRDEARKMLPQVRVWLGELEGFHRVIQDCDEYLGKAMEKGDELGGEMVNRYVKALAGAKEVLVKFGNREIQIKDVDRGLVDFPAYVGGKEVFLCWEKGEDDIEYWHDLTTGYGGREPL